MVDATSSDTSQLVDLSSPTSILFPRAYPLLDLWRYLHLMFKGKNVAQDAPMIPFVMHVDHFHELNEMTYKTRRVYVLRVQSWAAPCAGNAFYRNLLAPFSKAQNGLLCLDNSPI